MTPPGNKYVLVRVNLRSPIRRSISDKLVMRPEAQIQSMQGYNQYNSWEPCGHLPGPIGHRATPLLSRRTIVSHVFCMLD